MRTKRDRHLDEEQIIEAVVDETDLAPLLQGHLKKCPLCRSEKERFERDLERLGLKAKRFTPFFRKTVSFPLETKQGFWIRSRRWRLAFAVAMSAFVVASLLWFTILRTTPGERMEMLSREMQKDELFMTEVDVLIENALSPVYQDISSEAEADLDEEFLQFIIPDTENKTDAHYLKRKQGGKSLC